MHPPVDEAGTINYLTLAPLMRNYVTQLYAGREPIPGHWVRLVTRHYGTFWMNKMSGAVQAEVPLDVVSAVQSADGSQMPPMSTWSTLLLLPLLLSLFSPMQHALTHSLTHTLTHTP